MEGQAGRPGWDPRLLISLWVYGYSEGVGLGASDRADVRVGASVSVADGRWVVNAHTLTDFRAKHEKALKELFVQILGLLSADGLITLERVMQDGTKIRAKAAPDSFRRKEPVEQALKQAAEQVAAVEEMGEEETSRRAPRHASERSASARSGWSKLLRNLTSWPKKARTKSKDG